MLLGIIVIYYKDSALVFILVDSGTRTKRKADYK